MRRSDSRPSALIVARHSPPRRARGFLVALLLAAGTLACRGRSQHLVRFPLPKTEWVNLASETRPGCWLSPGDALLWDLPAGPRRRLQGAYASALVGVPPGSLKVTLAAGEAGTERAAHSLVVPLAADPARWQSWSVELPPTRTATRLEIAYRDPSPGSATRSLFLTEPTFAVARRQPPRTIVLFLIDSLRADRVSGYGYRRPTTPRLDGFFREGLRAETCLPVANWTLPSHASLLTSVSVARHGVARYGQVLPENLETLAGSLARAGYRTLAVTGGAFVDPIFGFGHGFDRYAVVTGPAARAVQSGLAMLAEHCDEPIFLFFHTYQLHDYVPDEAAARELFPDLSALGPHWGKSIQVLRKTRSTDPRFTEWFRARYDATIRTVDAAFGGFLDGLERMGRLEQTAVLFTSDHGESLCDRSIGKNCLSWGHGSPYLFEEELLVPLEVRVPWMPGSRGTIRGNTSLLDVAPTLLAAAGRPAPASFEGRSLFSGDPRTDRIVVTEAPPLDALAAREGSFKLIRRTGAPQTSWFDGGPFSLLPAQECFDLARDPGETRPVPCSSSSSARLEEGVDRYVASAFPDSLVLRVPARLLGAGKREALVQARGLDRAPVTRSFGLGASAAMEQRGAVAQVRFRAGLSPVWIAFQPADGSRAVQIEVAGLDRLVSVSGESLRPGTYGWQGLSWPSGALPPGVAVFTTPPSPVSSSSVPPLPADVVARLLSLGYLREAPLPGPILHRAAEASEGGAALSPGEVQVRRAD